MQYIELRNGFKNGNDTQSIPDVPTCTCVFRDKRVRYCRNNVVIPMVFSGYAARGRSHGQKNVESLQDRNKNRSNEIFPAP